MARVLLVLAGVAITIYALVDAAQSHDADVRVMPKPYWLTLIILVPVLGALAWLAWGRPAPDQPSWWEALARGRFGTRATPSRTSAPDDDPAFLAALADEPRRPRPPRPPTTPHRDGATGNRRPDQPARPGDGPGTPAGPDDQHDDGTQT
jgi:hypothetical protein